MLLVGEDVFCLLQLAAQASDRSRDLRCFRSEVVDAWGGRLLIVGRVSWLLAPILIMAATRARPFTQDQTQRLHPYVASKRLHPAVYGVVIGNADCAG